MPRKRVNIDAGYLIQLHESGISVKQLSERFNISRATIYDRFSDAGFDWRNRSEAMYTRMANTDANTRQKLSAAAHAAVRGKSRSMEELRERAITRQQTLQYVGVGETEFASMLTKKGLQCAPQLAVGRYNIDIAIPPIAVEIHRNRSSPLAASNNRKKLEYMRSNGWAVVFVWIKKDITEFRESQADYIVSLYKRACVDPTVLGQYWVIRGDCELYSPTRGKSYNIT